MTATHGTWGNRVRVYESDSCLVTYLDLEPNQRCSWHYHKTSFNRFYVISGVLKVKTEKGYTTTLREGTVFDVEPGIKHEFQTGQLRAKVIEVAFVIYNKDDIWREKLGGKLNDTTY